jgi:16S rRNA (cytosine967-C5)-methyltransferase
MPITHALFNALVEALTLVLPLHSPADVSLKLFFRDRPKLGHRDRGFIAETIYAVLRHRRLIAHLSPKATPRAMTLLAMTRFQNISIGDLNAVLKRDEAQWLLDLKKKDLSNLPLAIEAELPDWVIERLKKFMGDAEILKFGQSMMTTAPLDLRVNSLKSKREPVLKRLQQEGIVCEPTKYSPLGIRLADKISLAKHPAFLEGFLEVQDEGSQLLGLLLGAKRGEMVVDFCAGAGGKSLMIGAEMASTGRLYAFDVSEKRLANLGPRLKRSGLSNVTPQRIVSENDTKIKRLAGKIDRVLVDAPCTGLGTLRRNPDLKYRQTEAGLAELNVKQASILKAAAKLVTVGGTLVYATCSVLREENEMIVEGFLASNLDFDLVTADDILKHQKIQLTGMAPYLRLSPQKHSTDGFFAAVLTRLATPRAKPAANKAEAATVTKKAAAEPAAKEKATAKTTAKATSASTTKSTAKTSAKSTAKSTTNATTKTTTTAKTKTSAKSTAGTTKVAATEARATSKTKAAPKATAKKPARK